VLLQQRARCIAEKFQERTASEAEPLSRERVREIIQRIVADLDDAQRCESAGAHQTV
jgi:hypothetical protein